MHTHRGSPAHPSGSPELHPADRQVGSSKAVGFTEHGRSRGHPARCYHFGGKERCAHPGTTQKHTRLCLGLKEQFHFPDEERGLAAGQGSCPPSGLLHRPRSKVVLHPQPQRATIPTKCRVDRFGRLTLVHVESPGSSKSGLLGGNAAGGPGARVRESWCGPPHAGPVRPCGLRPPGCNACLSLRPSPFAAAS